MFTESLLETAAPQGKWATRKWTTVVSFTLETLAIALLVLIPLLSSVALPSTRLGVINIPYGSPKAPPPAVQRHSPTGAVRALDESSLRLHVPQAIRKGITPERNTEAAQPATIPAIGSGFPGGDRNIAALLNLPATAAAPPPPPKPTPEPTRIRISQMQPGALIHQVQPVYPGPAKMARTQGNVVLAAIIGRDGTIRDLRVLSGHPLLATAAVDAVSQWRYRPYILNGQPVEVETQISINFTLQ